MKVELVVFVDREGFPHVFVKPAPWAAELELMWELWERPDLAREISVAIAAAIDALRSEAADAMGEFFRVGRERLTQAAAKTVLPSGPYAGRTLAEIAAAGEQGEAWLLWCARQPDHPVREQVLEYAFHYMPGVYCRALNELEAKQRGGP